MSSNREQPADPRGYIRNCDIIMREGDEVLFEQIGGQVFCYLDGYRIEPIEATPKAEPPADSDRRALDEIAYGRMPGQDLTAELAAKYESIAREALAQPPAALAKVADLISHLRCVLFTNGIEGAKHMAVIEDFRAALAKVEPADREVLAAWLQHAYHVKDSPFVMERWRAVADEAIRRVPAPLVFPSEPRPPLGHQTERSVESPEAVIQDRYDTLARAGQFDQGDHPPPSDERARFEAWWRTLADTPIRKSHSYITAWSAWMARADEQKGEQP